MKGKRVLKRVVERSHNKNERNANNSTGTAKLIEISPQFLWYKTKDKSIHNNSLEKFAKRYCKNGRPNIAYIFAKLQFFAYVSEQIYWQYMNFIKAMNKKYLTAITVGVYAK